MDDIEIISDINDPRIADEPKYLGFKLNEKFNIKQFDENAYYIFHNMKFIEFGEIQLYNGININILKNYNVYNMTELQHYIMVKNDIVNISHCHKPTYNILQLFNTKDSNSVVFINFDYFDEKIINNIYKHLINIHEDYIYQLNFKNCSDEQKDEFYNKYKLLNSVNIIYNYNIPDKVIINNIEKNHVKFRHSHTIKHYLEALSKHQHSDINNHLHKWITPKVVIDYLADIAIINKKESYEKHLASFIETVYNKLDSLTVSKEV